MAPKMVTNFRRTLSFPDQPSNTTTKPPKNLHVRSASLPCHRTHPIISQLKDELNELTTWSISGSRTSSWICTGLTRLKSVHESLDDLLLLPPTRESLRYSASFIEKLLEDFLKFADVYGLFQTLVMRLREEYSLVEIAFRRNHESKIGVHVKNLNKIGKEIGKLVSNVYSIGKNAIESNEDEIEVINEVVKVTVMVSGLVFSELERSVGGRKTSSSGMGFGKRITKSCGGVGGELGIREFIIGVDVGNFGKEEVKVKMLEVEDCVVEIEKCGEKAYRNLINTRVSLLNVLTQS